LHRGLIAAPVVPVTMRAGVQETIDALVTNEGDQPWRWGKEARPEIRIGYRWTGCDGPAPEVAALRTALPADIAPGTSHLVPVHVVPPTKPGRYELELQILHEGVVTFASTSPVEVEVAPRQVIAVAGRPDTIARTLALVAPTPDVEPLVVLGNENQRADYGDYATAAGFRAPLLDGLENCGRLRRALRLYRRSRWVVRSARACRRDRISYDTRLAESFDLISGASCLVVAGTDWLPDAAAGREWWRLVTTMRACRALGLEVFVADAAVPAPPGMRAAVLRRLVRRTSRPLAELSFGTVPVGELVPAEQEQAEDLVDALT
jgi:hypothetical protein